MYYRADKVLDSNKAIETLQSTNLVFVSGVFDILHAGHTAFLRKAKEIGGDNSKLLVALHTDKYVKQYKGEKRPYMSLDQRIDVLSELECVDYVIAWDGWENIVDFVKELKPVYLAVTQKSFEYSHKGEWKGESWSEVASQIGADVVEISVIENFASSNFAHLFE